MDFCWIKLTCWVFFFVAPNDLWCLHLCNMENIEVLGVMWRVCFQRKQLLPDCCVVFRILWVSYYSGWSISVIFATSLLIQSNKKKKPNALITISFGAASVLGLFSITTRSNGIVSCWNNIWIGRVSCQASTIGASPSGAYQSIVAHNQIWWIFNLNRSIWYLRVLSQIARDTQYRWPESMT